MNLIDKKRTIKELEKIRVRNKKSAFLFEIAMRNEKRLVLRNLYRSLYEQKIKFLKEIEEKIEQVKREISPLQDPKLLSFYKRKRCKLSSLYLKYKMKRRFTDLYKRELKSYYKYQKCLSKTNHARVREILLAHKHKISTNLSEMNKTGLMKFPVT
ncbi:hypothetical protein [Christiangramia aquimixticola]|uniref:hypothetical protein n=1 Tax=Christiangramia aquimixticola TaxID=1697558 RepID=UPI003AA7DAD8